MDTTPIPLFFVLLSGMSWTGSLMERELAKAKKSAVPLIPSSPIGRGTGRRDTGSQWRSEQQMLLPARGFRGSGNVDATGWTLTVGFDGGYYA